MKTIFNVNDEPLPWRIAGDQILNANGGQNHTFDMDSMLQLPADKKTASGDEIKGADASLIEMDGSGIDTGLNWATKMLNIAKLLANLSQKDPEKIKGQMSGTAMMLLDEDFIDFVECLKVPYGDDGLVEVVRIFIIAYQHIKSDRFKGVKPDQIEELELNWPRQYEPEPTELKALQEALSGAVISGFMLTEEGSEILGAALDKTLTATEPEENTLLAEPGKEQDHGMDLAEKQMKQTEKLETMKIKAKPKPVAKKPAAKKAKK